MIRNVVGWSLRLRFLMLGVAAAFVALGYTQLSHGPVDVLPEFNPPYVEVQTEALGLSAEEVEQLITVPLEADLLHGVAWLDEIHSESVPGLSSIVMLFEPGTDVIRARQIVAERLTQAHALPNVSRPPVMLQPLSSTSRVMMIGLRSADVSLIDMSVLARWTVRPRLLGVPGVANVSMFGLRERQLQVLVDPERLHARGVTLEQVIETAGNSLWASPLTFLEAATPGTGGFIDTPNQRLGIQHRQPISGPDEMAKVPIHDAKGLVLGDVATIVQDHQPLIGDAVVKDGPGLVLVVEKFPEANTLETTRAIEEALAALGPGLKGIEVDSSMYRPASYIESAIGNIGLALIIGIVLAAVVLGVLLGWRVGVLAAATMPLAIGVAAVVLQLAGASLNAVTAAGLILALAIVIADVVAIGEGVATRRRADDASEVSARDVVIEATSAGLGRVAYATAIIGLIAVPVAAVSGAPAAFVPLLAAAFVMGVGASLVVAVTVAPALLVALVGVRDRPRNPSGILTRLGERYERAVEWALARSRPLLAGTAILAIAIALVAAPIVPQLADSLVPSFRERDLLVRWEGPAGTSRAEMGRVLARAGAELRSLPGVRDVGGSVGRAITSDRVVNANSADLWISIDPAADYAGTVAAVDEVVAGYPGFAHALTTYTSERIASQLSSDPNDLVVRIYGRETDVLRSKAAEVSEALALVPGIEEPKVIQDADQPTLEVEVDLAAAARYGLSPGEIRRATTTLLSGIEVGFLFEDQKVFEVVVWGSPDLRASLSSVGNVRIDAPGGQTVRLADVADVRIAPTPAAVRREGVMRIVDVAARVTSGDAGAVRSAVDAALAKIAFPLEYHPDARYPIFDRQAEMLRLIALILGAAILAFLVIQASLERWRLGLMAFLVFPAALTGSLVVALAADGALTLGGFAGLLAVLGITVRNGLSVLFRCQELERENGDHSRLAVVARGARDRLRPTLATALATIVAVVPFVVLGDASGMEVLRPLAISVIAGLVTSTALTLFVVPAVYYQSGPTPQRESSAVAAEPALSPA